MYLNFTAPEAPLAIKALIMSSEAILVSWRPPAQPNGMISHYTVYYKVEGKDLDPQSQKVPADQMRYEANGLEKNKAYEFWVTASTVIGEGQPSKSVVVMTNDVVPARIASFDDTFIATFKGNARLPCIAVGSPTPDVTWRVSCSVF